MQDYSFCSTIALGDARGSATSPRLEVRTASRINGHHRDENTMGIVPFCFFHIYAINDNTQSDEHGAVYDAVMTNHVLVLKVIFFPSFFSKIKSF